jgi:hypothetical protein
MTAPNGVASGRGKMDRSTDIVLHLSRFIPPVSLGNNRNKRCEMNGSNGYQERLVDSYVYLF